MHKCIHTHHIIPFWGKQCYAKPKKKKEEQIASKGIQEKRKENIVNSSVHQHYLTYISEHFYLCKPSVLLHSTILYNILEFLNNLPLSFSELQPQLS